MRHVFSSALFSLMLVLFGAAAQAEPSRIHFSGYAFETGGFGLSAAGDELVILANVTSIFHDDPSLPYDPASYQYTLAIDDLISQGEEDLGAGISKILFAGGTLAIYQDAGTASDWSEPHMDGEPPPSFVDGELWAGGALAAMRFDLFRAIGQGAFEAQFELTDGIAQAWFPGSQDLSGTLVPGHHTFQGTTYDLSLDGEIQPVEATAAGSRTLGAIKALY